MYLEISTTCNDLDKFGSPSSHARIFVGPFASDDLRNLFREHWERELNSGNHNPNCVSFVPYNTLPDGRCAILPRNYRGFLVVDVD